MFHFRVDEQVFYVVLGVVVAVGILSKMIVNIVLKRLVKAAENMNKSNHLLMRLVKAKFEHACMVSEKVVNVGAFVDKYLYGYRVLGVRLHSLRRLEKAAAVLCALLGVGGAAAVYLTDGMGDAVFRVGGMGLAMGVLVYVFHLTTDENYRVEMARNYMVDYLENVCLHRYEKASKKEKELAGAAVQAAQAQKDSDAADVPKQMQENMAADVPGQVKMSSRAKRREQKRAKAKAAVGARLNVQVSPEAASEPLFPGSEPVEPIPQSPDRNPDPAPGAEVPSPQTPPEVLPPAMPEPYEAPNVAMVQAASEKREDKRGNQADRAMDKDVVLRRILEEYMA